MLDVHWFFDLYLSIRLFRVEIWTWCPRAVLQDTQSQSEFDHTNALINLHPVIRHLVVVPSRHHGFRR